MALGDGSEFDASGALPRRRSQLLPHLHSLYKQKLLTVGIETWNVLREKSHELRMLGWDTKSKTHKPTSTAALRANISFALTSMNSMSGLCWRDEALVNGLISLHHQAVVLLEVDGFHLHGTLEGSG